MTQDDTPDIKSGNQKPWYTAVAVIVGTEILTSIGGWIATNVQLAATRPPLSVVF
jgi:hypothetical protein